jgi:hypothetical protein
MSITTLAYARCAYKSFSCSARHVAQLIASHQSLQTGRAYLSYACLAEESSLTRRRVIQLVAWLEAQGALEVRRGHGRGHVNFYRILREEDGEPVPTRSARKVKSSTASVGETVKFPTPPAGEKVQSQPDNLSESLRNITDKVVETKERKDKDAPPAPFFLALDKPETQNPWWCPAHGFCHGARLPDHRPECRVEQLAVERRHTP